MKARRMLRIIPIAIRPAERLTFRRAAVLPGVWVQQHSGPLAGLVDDLAKTSPVSPGFAPTHLIVVEERSYFDALDRRLQAEGTKRDVRPDEWVDIDGIARQVLISMTLIGRLIWEVGGCYCCEVSETKTKYIATGYSHSQTTRVSELFRWGPPAVWFAAVSPRALRSTCTALDAYYRSGIWWVDPLSVSLGYLWSSLTTPQPELSFTGMCMALEAIATSTHTEITHILAERCAVLCRRKLADRRAMYSEVKRLYALRGRIVHGRSAPKKGPITWETLSVSAKRSMVPLTELHRMLAITLEVINSVLHSPDLIEILRTRQSEEKTNRALDEYFQSLLLG